MREIDVKVQVGGVNEGLTYGQIIRSIIAGIEVESINPDDALIMIVQPKSEDSDEYIPVIASYENFEHWFKPNEGETEEQIEQRKKLYNLYKEWTVKNYLMKMIRDFKMNDRLPLDACLKTPVYDFFTNIVLKSYPDYKFDNDPLFHRGFLAARNTLKTVETKPEEEVEK